MTDDAEVFANSWAADARSAADAFWSAAARTARAYGLDPARCGEYVAARLKTAEALVEAIRHADELLLASACVDGNTAAIAALDERYLLPLRSVLGSNNASHDDVLQVVREKLLLGGSPKLATYSGRGDLRRFCKAVAVRALLARNRGRRDELMDEGFFDVLSATSNPELEAVKARYRDEFKRAFSEAFATLPPRDQLWLRQYYLQGVKLERLAKMHGVVASTVSRALEKARTVMMLRVREALVQKGIAPRDVDSVLNLLGSRMSLPID